MQTIVDQLPLIMPTAMTGSVVRTEGLTAAVAGFPAPVGALVEIERQAGDSVQGEVIGFREGLTLVFPLGDIAGVRRGSRARLLRTAQAAEVGDSLLGRVIDARGRPVDGKAKPPGTKKSPIDRPPPSAVSRQRIAEPLSTGVRAIDGLLTCGRGQRMGVFSGSGVGKSVLLGMMARYTSADVNVIAMIGERGREVNEFLERDLGPEGLARSVVVVATSNEPALLRVQAARTATAVAEHFRDQGKEVLLLMDSLTRFATAQREIGLAAGEPPTTRGYPPSVFAMLPRLVERAGRGQQGGITAYYSVLVEGDDMDEPISDAVRGLLDGHTVLSRKLAGHGHYPAIDVLQSISRLTPVITPPEQQAATAVLRDLLAAYQEHEDVISIGAYRRGANPRVDAAIAMRDEINAYLRQKVDEPSSVQQARSEMLELAQRCAAVMQGAQATSAGAASARRTAATGAK